MRYKWRERFESKPHGEEDDLSWDTKTINQTTSYLHGRILQI
jgi:hypothetical protein